MKNLILQLFAFVIFTNISFSQIGINSDASAPSPSAQLDIKSTEKGLLIPRMTSIERLAIPTPEIGLMVFDKDFQEIFIYNSDGWKQGTLSKLPFVLSSDKLNVIKVTNSLLDSYPNISTVAEFISLGNLGIAIKARSTGNAPTIDARNESGSAISAHSENSTTGYFSSNLGIGIASYAFNNIGILGQNNSSTSPTAKFMNIGGCPAMELNSELNINTSKILGGLNIKN